MIAIHMFFDCLGIGIGLWASVAATWKPDGRYTFGYSRVETLSGFTNGQLPWATAFAAMLVKS
jgi:zinc transporter 5/7